MEDKDKEDHEVKETEHPKPRFGILKKRSIPVKELYGT